MTTCPACGKGKLRKKRVEESMFGVSLGEFPAESCPNCGETFLDDAAMAVLEKRAKAAGIWGLGKKMKVVKSGNSLVLRIPTDVAKFMKLKAGKEVFLHPEGDDRLVVDIEG
jgi:YgiT-type zinc finger domain-containing protein